MSVRTGKIVFSCCLLCSSVVMLLKKGISCTCVLCDVVQVCVCVCYCTGVCVNPGDNLLFGFVFCDK